MWSAASIEMHKHKTPCNAGPGIRKLVYTFSIVIGLIAGDAHAQVAVVDSTSINSNLESFAKQLAQTVEQYKVEFETLQNMLVTAQSLGTSPSIFTSQLPMIESATELIRAKCPGASGISALTDAMNTITSSLSPRQSIVSAQQQICAQIVLLRIKQYNATATVYNKMPQYSTALARLNELTNGINSLGDSSAATTAAQGYQSLLSTDVRQWQTEISADDAMIQSLLQQQSILANVALRGGNTILGNVVQASTLEAVFSQ
jgi:phage gp36-like protein